MKVIIVGGSICGCACAHALLKNGCEVVVLERATSVTAAGAVCSPSHRQSVCILPIILMLCLLVPTTASGSQRQVRRHFVTHTETSAQGCNRLSSNVHGLNIGNLHTAPARG